MTKGTCAVGGCASPIEKREWCGKHYQRWYNHGDPTYERPRHDVCTVDGCGDPTRSKVSGLCEMHYYRRYRHGDTDTVIDTRRPEVRYRAAHARIRQDRGAASAHPCVDCGRVAEHWTYDHADPDECTSDTGQAYSMDPWHYRPRCVPCHAHYDGTGWNQYTGPRPRLAR